jgi:fumarate reductase subunit C
MAYIVCDAEGATMSEHTASYTEYHPRWYRPRMSTYWWIERWSSVLFILRELTSVFVAWSVIFLLLLFNALRLTDPEQTEQTPYPDFIEWARHPIVIGLNVISLVMVIYHAVTWFNLAPRAVVVRLNGKRLPDIAITGPNYALWAIVSIVAAWIFLGGR